MRRQRGDVPAAETDVIADAIFRNAAQCVIERRDPKLRPFTITPRALLHEGIVHVGENGVVDLKNEARIDDGEVLLPQRIRDRENVISFIRGVCIGRVVADACRRDSGEEGFFRVRGLEGHLQVRNIARNALVIPVFDRADTGMAGRAG